MCIRDSSYTNQKKVYTEMIASRKDWCFAGLFADEGKSTDAVDDLMIKIGHAPRRKFKVVEKESCRESR